MTRRREGQRAFGRGVWLGLLGPPETLLDPALRGIAGLLDDEALVDAVWRALRRRYPQSARRGRPATPAEVVMRLLVLKHLKGWSYEQLEGEVRGSVAYQLPGEPKNLPEDLKYEKFKEGKYSRFVLTGPYSNLPDPS